VIKSSFNLVTNSSNQEIIIFNTLYKSVVRLNKYYGEIYKKKEIHDFPDELRDFLIKNKIITKRRDESRILANFCNSIERTKKLRFVFFVTLGCNLACDYCYEPHDNKRYLKSNNYKKVLEIIRQYGNEYTYIFDWFGGEPLLKSKEIFDFLNSSMKMGIQYFSSITTNGILLNNYMFNECINYKINKFQITIDGLKQINDKHRKFENGEGTFNIVYKNILNMHKSSHKFEVILRVNIDKKSNIEAFLTELEDAIQDDERFKILIFPISNWGSNLNEETLFSTNELLHYSNSLFYKHKKLINFELASLLHGYIGCSYRAKDNFVINSEGKITDCTINFENDLIGNIQEIPKINKRRKTILCDHIGCVLFPICLGHKCKNSNKESCKTLIEQKEIILGGLLNENTNI